MNDLLTLDELADRLRVSRRTVEREVAAGRIRVVKMVEDVQVAESVAIRAENPRYNKAGR